MVEAEKAFQGDEKKFIEQNLKCEALKRRLEDIIESNEAYKSTLYVLNKELKNSQLKLTLQSTSTGGSSRKYSSPSKNNKIIILEKIQSCGNFSKSNLTYPTVTTIESEINVLEKKSQQFKKELNDVNEILNENV